MTVGFAHFRRVRSAPAYAQTPSTVNRSYQVLTV